MLYDIAKYSTLALVVGIAWAFGCGIGNDAHEGTHKLAAMANEQIKKWRAEGQMAKAEALEYDVAALLQKHGLPAPACC